MPKTTNILDANGEMQVLRAAAAAMIAASLDGADAMMLTADRLGEVANSGVVNPRFSRIVGTMSGELRYAAARLELDARREHRALLVQRELAE